jgi:hypothetical protein
MNNLKDMWDQKSAINLCVKVESICPQFGCHVALTGGTLYKEGERKDCDLLFYKIRQVPKIDVDGLFNALLGIGLVKQSGFGWVYKGIYGGKPVDMFFPENNGGDYNPEYGNDARQKVALDIALSGIFLPGGIS